MFPTVLFEYEWYVDIALFFEFTYHLVGLLTGFLYMESRILYYVIGGKKIDYQQFIIPRNKNNIMYLVCVHTQCLVSIRNKN